MGKKNFPSNPRLSATRISTGVAAVGFGGAGGIITHERRTRLAPTSHDTERFRRLELSFSSVSSKGLIFSMAKENKQVKVKVKVSKEESNLRQDKEKKH